MDQGNAILIVEDNADIREVFRTLFELEGFDVHVAENGEDALHRLDDDHIEPFLILLDLSMPVMDGWSFLDVLHRRNDTERFPVTVLSANVDPVQTRELKARYGCRVLRKPASVEALLGIANACREQGRAQSPPRGPGQ
ncbi:response regulator [Cognatilysobacter lacus]|uniref:Response regulator n=1 Tax=Cognatilysobacter lacus TaxID=1643323 RepID=A0A5D8Z721_9GAMM|nr:response regulator [Lysobacter lacus]TZF88484.1 response regulator [Lysobacter lacus]